MNLSAVYSDLTQDMNTVNDTHNIFALYLLCIFRTVDLFHTEGIKYMHLRTQATVDRYIPPYLKIIITFRILCLISFVRLIKSFQKPSE